VDLNAIIYNPISSTILKWLRFEFISWGHFSLAQQWFGINCWLILVDFHEIRHGSNTIQGDLFAIIFNSVTSIVLKLLRFKVVT
jgi:hypothetical protein